MILQCNVRLPKEILDAQIKTSKINGLVVYTVNFGGYDDLRSPPFDQEASYICFHNSSSKVPKGWTGILIEDTGQDIWLSSRAFKCLPHVIFPGSDRSLYVDASFLFRAPASDFVVQKCASPFTAFAHPDRVSIEQEVAACLKYGKGTNSILVEFVKKYDYLISVKNYRLISAGVLFREHIDENLNKSMELWFSHLMDGVDRDQIALPVALMQMNQLVNLLDENIYYNRFLVPKPHAGARLTTRFRWHLAQKMYLTGVFRPSVCLPDTYMD